MFTSRKIGRRFPTLAASAIFAMCLAWSAPADAQLVVTSSTDNGQGNIGGTLSAAIVAANASGGTITFAPGVTTVTLTVSMYGITANVGAITIDGGSGVTIDGQNQYQVFAVNDSSFAVNFSNLTINRGRAQGGAGQAGAGGGGGGLGGGGGIYVDQSATAGISVENVNFTNNSAVGGAGGAGGAATGTGGGAGNGGDGGDFNTNAGMNTVGTNAGGGTGGIPLTDPMDGNPVGNGQNGGYGGGGGGNSNNSTDTRSTGNGGGSGGINGQGGDGGLALGGALFIGNGSTVTIRGGSNFAASNTVTGGAAGSGTPGASAGNPSGGAIYVGTLDNTATLSTAVFDTSTTDTTVSGNIYANGNLRIQGGDAVVNWFGTTTLAPTGNTQVTRGTLNGTTNSLTGPIVLADANLAILRFTQAGLGTFNGSITGSGIVNLNGTGGVIFDQVNTNTGMSTNTFGYTGPTNVNNGVLFLSAALNGDVNVAAAGSFVGDGPILGNLTNTGLVSPGDVFGANGGIGTLPVAGNYTSNVGSVTQIQINSTGTVAGTNNDLIDLTAGSPILNGGTVFVQTTGGVYTPGTTYTFLRYTGLRSGPGFEGAVTNSAFLGADIVYNDAGKTIDFTLTRNATTYESVAATFNQAQVGAYLDANSAGAMGDFGTVLDNINTLSTSGAQAALDQLGGTIYGTAGRMGIQQTTFMYLMLRRGTRGNEEIGYEEIHADGRIAGEGSAGDESIQLVNFDDDPFSDQASRPNYVPVLRVRKQRRHTWNAWSTSYGTLSNGVGNGLNAETGRFGSFGSLTSAYRYVDDGLKLGVFGAYNHLNLRLNTPYQSSNSDDYQLGTYLRGDDGTSYFLAASSVGFDNYQTNRTIAFAQIGRQASSNYDGMQSTGYLEIGRKTQMWPLDLEPFVALQYTYLHQNGFVEQGADSINLAVPGIDNNSLRSLVGSRAALDLITFAGEPIKGEFLIAWLHENLDANTTIRSTFAGVGGAAFATEGVKFGRDWIVLGAGLSWAPSENTALAANYDALLNDTTDFHLASGSFQYRW